jgi:predicted  nucleic acid-binding Zn-ribbon protein
MEATAQEIGALLQLAQIDAEARSPSAGAHDRRREAALKCVPALLLDRYLRLLELGRCPVVVAMERGGCSGCHVRFHTMFESRARRSPAIHTCPRCHRMLYAPEFVREPQPVPSKPTPASTRASNAVRTEDPSNMMGHARRGP